MRWMLPLLVVGAACKPEPQPDAAAVPPPPISGGTLAIGGDGQYAVAADPDRDRVWIVDLVNQLVAAEVPLEPGDEPGRVAIGARGRAYVALRRGGQVVAVDVPGGQLRSRTPVCAAPRGLAYDAALDAVHVACLGGDLVSLAASDGRELRRVRLDPDLRDVVVHGADLYVTRFRSAELLVVDRQGTVTSRVALPREDDANSRRDGGFDAAVAWRAFGLDSGGVVIAHQHEQREAVDLTQDAPPYGGGGDRAIVHSAVTVVDPSSKDSPPQAVDLFGLVLVVDVAATSDGHVMAFAAAGSRTILVKQGTMVRMSADSSQPIAVAFDKDGSLWVQTQRPARLKKLDGPSIPLGEERKRAGQDVAHDLFHGDPLHSLACASCHPEAGDDGHVWRFRSEGSAAKVRRTLHLRGAFADGPQHWDGGLADFDALVREVMVRRMGEPDPGHQSVVALDEWLKATPRFALDPPRDPAAVERGRALFADADVACAGCHAGDRLSNQKLEDVGTGERLKVPSLVSIAVRPPFLHDGCAPTLAARFGSCGGGDAHGRTSQLSPSERADLIAYLETL